MFHIFTINKIKVNQSLQFFFITKQCIYVRATLRIVYLISLNEFKELLTPSRYFRNLKVSYTVLLSLHLTILEM